MLRIVIVDRDSARRSSVAQCLHGRWDAGLERRAIASGAQGLLSTSATRADYLAAILLVIRAA